LEDKIKLRKKNFKDFSDLKKINHKLAKNLENQISPTRASLSKYIDEK
jgi:hypothetical protein